MGKIKQAYELLAKGETKGKDGSIIRRPGAKGGGTETWDKEWLDS